MRDRAAFQMVETPNWILFCSYGYKALSLLHMHIRYFCSCQHSFRWCVLCVWVHRLSSFWLLLSWKHTHTHVSEPRCPSTRSLSGLRFKRPPVNSYAVVRIPYNKNVYMLASGCVCIVFICVLYSRAPMIAFFCCEEKVGTKTMMRHVSEMHHGAFAFASYRQY